MAPPPYRTAVVHKKPYLYCEPPKQHMKTAPLLTTALFMIGALAANSQDWRTPSNVKLEKAEDYAKYEEEVLACIDWLERTPQDIKKDNRMEANAFLLMWITGSPNVTIEINAEVLPFLGKEKNAELLMTFMGGWTRYALTDEAGGTDVVQGNLAGLRSVIHVYDKVGGCAKDKELDKLVKLEKEGKLEEWVRGKLKG